jgi:hypothetical protein
MQDAVFSRRLRNPAAFQVRAAGATTMHGLCWDRDKQRQRQRKKETERKRKRKQSMRGTAPSKRFSKTQVLK